MYPDDLKYTSEHEWVRVTGEGVVRVGVTWYAQDQLGDIVFVTLPEVGAEVQSGQPFGEIESTKSVSDVYAPVTGTVVARNDALPDRPEVVNSDPYGDGWIAEIRLAQPGTLDNLMDAADYERLISAD